MKRVPSYSLFCDIGESYNGSIAVSKTVHGGSNPSSPVKKHPKRTLDVFFVAVNYMNCQSSLNKELYPSGYNVACTCLS